MHLFKSIINDFIYQEHHDFYHFKEATFNTAELKTLQQEK
jgi:hypothetical protein